MKYFDYAPLFKYLKKHNIPKVELVHSGVIGQAALTRLNQHKGLSLRTILRIMDYLEITNINLIMEVKYYETY